MPALSAPPDGGAGEARTGDSQPSPAPHPGAIHDFNASYDGTPPWEIGRPQPTLADLAEQGYFTGRVLDAGCGTGEHALLAASRGLDATGIDMAPKAIARAQAKAAERGLSVRFAVGDALDLSSMGETFDTVIDCGLFHVFDDVQRARYVDQLAAVLVEGGRYLMLCFSDKQPGDWGPRRVSRAEIENCFCAPRWRIEALDEVTLDITLDPNGARAWRARIIRAGED